MGPNNSKGKIYDLIERYAEKWLPEVAKVLRRLSIAVIIGLVAYVIFLFGVLALIAYLLIYYLAK